jgi:hypothetical protein
MLIKDNKKYSPSFQYSTLNLTITEMSLHCCFSLVTAFVDTNIIRLQLLYVTIQTIFHRTTEGCNHFEIAMNVALCFASPVSVVQNAQSHNAITMTTHLRGYKFINSSQILWGI